MARGGAKGRKAKGGRKFAKADVMRMERLALEKANRALSAIEVAIAQWNASAEKPPALELRINRLREFHGALSGWEKRMLRSMAKEDVGARVGHLREFSDICHSFM